MITEICVMEKNLMLFNHFDIIFHCNIELLSWL